ncbi:MAG TPA: hypothetical protein VMH87_14960 [Pseudomonadales bacterium]|nr:hypothetical protein [Pseudomonadales bacterium]
MLTAVFAIIFFSIVSGYSQNLVQNGNFAADGGSFADWNISHAGGGTNYPNDFPRIYGTGGEDPGGANYYAQFLPEDNFSSDILSQDISTIPGDIYLVSFYAEDGAGHNFITDFNFGNFSYNLGDAFSIGPGEWWYGWTNFTFTLTASEAETDLSFLIHADNGSEFGVTGISVTAVPQPELQEAFVGGKIQVTVTNCNSQVIIQSSTDMVDWVNVYTNTAPCSYTDQCVMPRRFFRVAMVAQAQ